MRQKLISAKAFGYRGQALGVGEVFEASRRDARLLVAVKRAKLAPPEQPQPEEPAAEAAFEASGTYTAQAAEPESAAAPSEAEVEPGAEADTEAEAEAKADEPAAQYETRAMQAAPIGRKKKSRSK